jgi:hypothetical protein
MIFCVLSLARALTAGDLVAAELRLVVGLRLVHACRYYCMPLPTYAFEWGEAKGAKVPDQGNILSLSKGLADIAKQRAGWFRTPNVLIPWGCDYQYQNSELMRVNRILILYSRSMMGNVWCCNEGWGSVWRGSLAVSDRLLLVIACY